jgi:DNA-binding HxlR family transcriptional regulator
LPERTYNQQCGVALALDLIGERWALLVIRELTLGGKRFTDLKNGLPGIGTNVLATRLRQLETDGVVEKLRLAPPAATTIYVLTEYGRRLVPAMLALGRWGAESMGSPEGRHQRSEWFAVALNEFFVPDAAAGVEATIGLDLPDGSYRIRVDDGRIKVDIGPMAECDLRLETDVPTLVGYLRGEAPGAAVNASGDSDLLDLLPRLLSFEAQPVNVR